MTAEAVREPRAPLTRDRVLRAAIALADERGLEALSMRRLGQALGVEAMSLYNHVANKGDLLDGIADLVLGEIALPPGSGAWRAAVRGVAISAHEVLGRHPWACGLAMSPDRNLPTRLEYIEWILGRFREAGFSKELAYHAYHALDAHILGYTLWELGHSSPSTDLAELAERFIRESPADFPYLVEHARMHLAGVSSDEGEFALVLDLLLDGFERARAAELTPLGPA